MPAGIEVILAYVICEEPETIPVPPNTCEEPLIVPVGNNDVTCAELLTTASTFNLVLTFVSV
jgi:hypothetical protein